MYPKWLNYPEGGCKKQHETVSNKVQETVEHGPENTFKTQANSFSCTHILRELKQFEEYLHLRGHKLQPPLTKNTTYVLMR